MSDMYSYNNNSERNEKYGAEDFMIMKPQMKTDRKGTIENRTQRW